MKDIDIVIRMLKKKGFELEEEDDVAGFLGIDIQKQRGHIKLTQKGLTHRIIKALQVDVFTSSSSISLFLSSLVQTVATNVSVLNESIVV